MPPAVHSVEMNMDELPAPPPPVTSSITQRSGDGRQLLQEQQQDHLSQPTLDFAIQEGEAHNQTRKLQRIASVTEATSQQSEEMHGISLASSPMMVQLNQMQIAGVVLPEVLSASLGQKQLRF